MRARMTDAARKPEDAELDVHGLTHVGKVRSINQDQFLIASIHKRVQIQATSLGDQDQLPLGDERLAFLAMVADGVGGNTHGEQASATAVATALRYVTESMNCYYRADSTDESFVQELQAAAMRAHEAVVAEAAEDGKTRKRATTLTLYMGVWPHYYLLQVGDSRYYVYRDGVLTQISRDQTIAQDLVDAGALTKTAATRTPLAGVLSSAIGGSETMPVVTAMPADWDKVHVLCSDGLTKHVTDERIAEVLAGMTSAKQAAEQLLQEALDGGGTDNITIIIGRTVPRRAT
jgi:protein phosphatase